MGRSVSYLSRAQKVFYIALDNSNDQDDLEFIWDDFTENVNFIFQKYKSMDQCNRWDDRETQIIFENGLIEVGISEYCGLASISLRAKEQGSNYKHIESLGINYIEKITPKLEQELCKVFEVYNKQGSFSNGEGVYSKVN